MVLTTWYHSYKKPITTENICWWTIYKVLRWWLVSPHIRRRAPTDLPPAPPPLIPPPPSLPGIICFSPPLSAYLFSHRLSSNLFSPSIILSFSPHLIFPLLQSPRPISFLPFFIGIICFPLPLSFYLFPLPFSTFLSPFQFLVIFSPLPLSPCCFPQDNIFLSRYLFCSHY